MDLGRAQDPICVSRTHSITPELIHRVLLECRVNVVSLDLQVEDCEQAPVGQTNRTEGARTTKGAISDVNPVLVKGLYPRRQTFRCTGSTKKTLQIKL